MAKLLGVIRYGGKLGQTVGYRGANGKRLVRARVDEISNPRSTGQNIQRMVFSTAAVSLGHLSEVLRSSVEGVKAGAPSLAYLRGKALYMLRTSDIMQGNGYRYALKGSADFVVNPYQISKGSLAPVAIGDFNTGSDNGLHLGMAVVPGSSLDAATFSDVFPGVALGDQITFIQVAQEIGTLRPGVFYCRIAAKTNELQLFIPSVGSGEGFWVLNEAALDLTKCEGNWRGMEFSIMGSEIVMYPTLQPATFESDFNLAYGIIVSNRATGKRSTSFLKVASDIASIYPWNADVAAPTYGNVATPVDVAYTEYCDNSADVVGEIPSPGIELIDVRDQSTSVSVAKVDGVYQVPSDGNYVCLFNKNVQHVSFSIDLSDGAGGVSIGETRPFANAITLTTGVGARGTFRIRLGQEGAILGNGFVIDRL